MSDRGLPRNKRLRRFHVSQRFENLGQTLLTRDLLNVTGNLVTTETKVATLEPSVSM